MRTTALYAGLLAFVGLFLWLRVSGTRMKLRISMLDGGNPEMADVIRRHGNFAEHVPFALLLIGIVEVNGASATLIHALGATLTFARVCHPLGLRHDRLTHPLRAVGAFGTFFVMLIAAGVAVWQGVGS